MKRVNGSIAQNTIEQYGATLKTPLGVITLVQILGRNHADVSPKATAWSVVCGELKPVLPEQYIAGILANDHRNRASASGDDPIGIALMRTTARDDCRCRYSVSDNLSRD